MLARGAALKLPDVRLAPLSELPAGTRMRLHRRLLAFAALTKALHLSSVLFVNVLNASQTAMAAVIGVLMFGEASSWPMVLGVLLTVVGLLMMKGWRRPSPANIAQAPPVTAATQEP